MRYLLSEIASAKVYSTYGTFATGETVTIEIFKNGVSEPLTSNVCVEVGTTGIFAFDLSNITTQPTAYSELYWLMSEATPKNESGLIIAGGWVETVEPLGEADTCKITIDLYSGDGECTVAVEDLFDPNKKNYMELPDGTAVYLSSRYFKLGQYKPSYDRLTGQAYWVFPQGAVINVKLASFGIESNAVTVPAQSTIDLYTLLNP